MCGTVKQFTMHTFAVYVLQACLVMFVGENNFFFFAKTVLVVALVLGIFEKYPIRFAYGFQYSNWLRS